MDRRTNKKRIEELEAMLKKPWYGTLEFWSIATSITAILIAVYANKIALSNNKLEQAAIRSSHINYCYNLIDEIGNELKEDTIINSNLLNKFASHTYILEPFDHELESDRKTNKLSPGRGILLNSIMNQNINKNILEKIFNKCTFESSKLFGIKWDSVIISNAKLAQSLIHNSKILYSIIDSTDWNGSTFVDTKFEFDTLLNQCTFNQCLMTNVSFRGSVIKDNVEFNGCQFNNVNFKDTKIRNIPSCLLNNNFEHCNMTCTTFENINLQGAKFYNCLWDCTTFINCNMYNININLKQKNLYNYFDESHIQCLKGISYSNCQEYKIRLVNSKLDRKNPLIQDDHFIKYHTIKDTMINNKQMVIANFKS